MSATFAAIVSPPGAGGIAVIEIWGEGAVSAVQHIFTSKGSERPLSRPDHLYYGTVSDDQGIIDEALCVMTDGKVEITTHGGVHSPKAVLNALKNQGVEPAGSPLRAPNAYPATPLCQAAAESLIQTQTWPAARMVLDQLGGAIDRELAGITEAPDRSRLETLIRYGESSNALLDPTRVLLAGAPNVGKSTLFNALCEEDRVLVSAIPGTTRDAIEERVAWGGFPVNLMDSAGLRETDDPIEKQGVVRAWDRANEADIVCFLFDGTRKPSDEEISHFRRINRRVVSIVTKIDLVPDEKSVFDAGFLAESPIRISVATREGLDHLQDVLVQQIAPHGLPPTGAPVPFLRELQDALVKAGECLDAGNPEGVKASLERFLPQS